MSSRDPRTAATTEERAGFDVGAVRRDFPILARTVHGKPLAYLDNSATAQKPQCVLDALERFYTEANANVHRGIHELSERATAWYEGARETVRRFLNAGSAEEIVFVRGTTEAINLVASSFGRTRMKAGDQVLISEMEHHSNIVPWQLLREQLGIELVVVPVNDRGEMIYEEYERRLGPRTRLVAVCHVSNALGTVNPVADIVAAAHGRNVPVLLDGAQAAPHLPVDVRALGCDFYAFSGHKVFGPTGIGALYGRRELLDAMPPYQGGGEMIRAVSFDQTLFNVVPHKFEAGTANIAGAIGLAAALEYVEALDWDAVQEHEHDLLAHATEGLAGVPGIRFLGTAREKAGVVSFVLDDVHAHDLGTILDQDGIAIRAGHHCAMPVMERFGVPASARASFAFYNTRTEVDRLVAAVHGAREIFG